MTPKRIGLIGFDRVTAFHLIGMADAFSSTALDDGYGGRIACYEVCTIGAPNDSFRTESGVTFTAATDLRHAPPCDTLIVAGGAGLREPRLVEEISAWLLDQAEETRRLAAVCSGIYALAATGWLEGREVTTHWRMASDLARRYPSLKIDHRKPLVRDGRYYTARGLSGGINIALTMIQEDYGPHLARTVSSELTFSPSEQAHDSLAAAGAMSIPNHTADRFADLVSWIVRHLDSDLSVETLARRACICPSHFSKAFKSVFGQPPTEFVETLRLNEARRRLVKRQKTLQSVALSVGFTNPATFQRAFERRFGTRPASFLGTPAKPASPIGRDLKPATALARSA